MGRIDAGAQLRESAFGGSPHDRAVPWRADDLLPYSLIARAADEAAIDQHLPVKHAEIMKGLDANVGGTIDDAAILRVAIRLPSLAEHLD